MIDLGSYPPPAFYFGVVVGAAGGPTSGSPALDGSFQEVSGIKAEIQVEEVPEGGENRTIHRLPGRVKYPNLVLKRGLVTQGSFLANWFSETVGGNYVKPIETHLVQVNLLGADGFPRVSWIFEHAYPVTWELDSLDATANRITVETLELAYSVSMRADWG